MQPSTPSTLARARAEVLECAIEHCAIEVLLGAPEQLFLAVTAGRRKASLEGLVLLTFPAGSEYRSNASSTRTPLRGTGRAATAVARQTFMLMRELGCSPADTMEGALDGFDPYDFHLPGAARDALQDRLQKAVESLDAVDSRVLAEFGQFTAVGRPKIAPFSLLASAGTRRVALSAGVEQH